MIISKVILVVIFIMVAIPVCYWSYKEGERESKK